MTVARRWGTGGTCPVQNKHPLTDEGDCTSERIAMDVNKFTSSEK